MRGRRHTSDQGRTPDRWDLSLSSTASDPGSVGRRSRRGNPVWLAVKSCFSAEAGAGDFDALTASTSTNERKKHNIYGISNYSTRSQQQQSRSVSFTLADVQKATKNFSPDYKIGQGGFGIVYRGRLQDGTFVAIKRAKKAHDNHLGVEFHNEISTLSSIDHLNLVKFLGYIEHEDERIVVVEYVANGTLREHLDCTRGDLLDLGTRLDIAIDVAHAVTYLHMYADHPIIHRDIKASNILLTENLRAKVADFGFARAGEFDAQVTHISTQVKGTAGYLDPEYLRTYQLTTKSDVYSFGVLLVELISGRRPIEPKRDHKERLTTKWAMKRFLRGKSPQVLDPKLPRNPATILALEKILELSSKCLAPTRQDRPSMRTCAEILWCIRKDYKDLLTPEGS